MLGEGVIASVGLTAQIGNFAFSFAGLWLAVKWPEIAILRTQERLRQMADLFARRLTLVMLSFAGMALVVFVAGDLLVKLKGAHTQLLHRPFLALYFIYLAQRLFYEQFAGLAMTENVIPFFKINLLTGLGVLAASLVLTWAYGLWGLLLAPLIVELSGSAWYTVRRGFQGQPFSVPQFCRAAFYRRNWV